MPVNLEIRDSNIENCDLGTNNICTEPMFLDSANQDYRLDPKSDVYNLDMGWKNYSRYKPKDFFPFQKSNFNDSISNVTVTPSNITLRLLDFPYFRFVIFSFIFINISSKRQRR